MPLQAAPYLATGTLTAADRWAHVATRLGIRRNERRVEPGLYRLGAPTAASPVCVTANYQLSFDALRTALVGRDAWLLVLDTRGINVWCAAGKGTFGTDELVARIQASGLHGYVSHRTLILPQLGAPGVAAHLVRRRAGFSVRYGPVRAEDLPRYLDEGDCTAEMRQVTFTIAERAVLAPIEAVHQGGWMLLAALVLYLLAGIWGAVGAVAAVLSGALLFPLLLPWLPTHDFASKGLLLGAAVTLPVALGLLGSYPDQAVWVRALAALGLMLLSPAVVAYLSMNFTGSTPITSQSWVKREMMRYLRWMVGMAAGGSIMIIAAAIVRWIGG